VGAARVGYIMLRVGPPGEDFFTLRNRLRNGSGRWTEVGAVLIACVVLESSRDREVTDTHKVRSGYSFHVLLLELNSSSYVFQFLGAVLGSIVFINLARQTRGAICLSR
jgi:hypothetical protein